MLLMKQVEKYPLTPVEQELSFVSWCRENKIRKLVFDGDDTLWQIKLIFILQMEKSYRLLASSTSLSQEVWKKEITEINDSLFEAHGVFPGRWNLLVDELNHRHHLSSDVVARTKNIFSEIYTTPPSFINGTEEALKFFKKIGIDTGIVTHANKDWTYRKYKWLQLDRFLNWDDVYIIDENSHKTKESWQQAFSYFRVNPVNCLVGGDSPRADINPTVNLGVRHAFLLQNSYELWSIHQQPVDENKVRTISSINDLRYLGVEMIFRK